MSTLVNFLLAVTAVAGIYGVLCIALNLEFGHGGLINFGIVAYFAAGAYGYVILTQPPPSGFDTYVVGLGQPIWVGFLGAGAAGMLFAVITGWPCLRLRGEYLALTTFAFAEVLHSFLINERRVSNGTVGFSGIDRPLRGLVDASDYRLVFVGLVVAFLLVVYWMARRLVRSPYGRTLRAISDDEVAAALAEKPVERRRLEIFLFGALVSGFAGAFYAWYTTVVNPALFTAEVTFVVWIALVLGGIGSNFGAVLGVFILIGFEEALRFLNFSADASARVSAGRTALVGLLLVLLLRFRSPSRAPAGSSVLRGRLRRSGTPEAPAARERAA